MSQPTVPCFPLRLVSQLPLLAAWADHQNKAVGLLLFFHHHFLITDNDNYFRPFPNWSSVFLKKISIFVSDSFKMCFKFDNRNLTLKMGKAIISATPTPPTHTCTQTHTNRKCTPVSKLHGKKPYQLNLSINWTQIY